MGKLSFLLFILFAFFESGSRAFLIPSSLSSSSSSSSFGRLLSLQIDSTTTTKRRRNNVVLFSTVGSSSSSITTTTTTTTTTNKEQKGVDNDENDENHSKIRPIHQNWWPVSTTYYLKKDRPNPIDLLNKKLVVFWSEEEGEWKCLDDRCSHRFAPLSEGRVLNNKKNGSSSSDGTTTITTTTSCLQCAYHGWEFDGQGKCQKVPQSKTGTGGRSVTSYPVKVAASMIFVWSDPNSYETIGKFINIPTFPALEESVSNRGDWTCFMRDLPYGYELLGENLLDLSHLPFSHHGVGSLKRDIGCPLPFKMLSSSQKSSIDNNPPLYEAILEDAANCDPQFRAMPPGSCPPNATLNLGFYEPSHVRYTRQLVPGEASRTSYVALYLCPTSNNKSRVFLFNIFPPPPKQQQQQSSPKKSWSTIKQKLVASFGIKKQQMTATTTSILRGGKKFTFTPTQSHLISHQIFDGDGIFLHKQGDRMQRAVVKDEKVGTDGAGSSSAGGGLSYKDYDTPSSADIMVNAFRRYTNVAGQRTRSMNNTIGLQALAEAVMPRSGYNDNLPRSVMLDRYESHTKHCRICMEALQQAQIKKQKLEFFKTLLIGGIGASSVTFVIAGAILSFAASLLLGGVPSSSSAVAAAARTTTTKLLFRVSAALSATAVTFAATCFGGYRFLSKRQLPKVEKEIQQFLFEDYIHSEKN